MDFFYIGLPIPNCCPMKLKFVPALLCSAVITQAALSQDVDSAASRKTGFIPGGVPAVAYDTDVGFLYGIILNLYFYGNGSRYPKFDHSMYLEWSKTTKGSDKYILRYDSDRLIHGVRTLGEVSYLTEQTLDFYGFNGYRARYNHAFEDDSKGNPDYLSRVYYRQERKMLRLRMDLSGDLRVNSLKWFGGIEYYDVRLDTVDIGKLNNGKDASEKLPGVGGGLFGRYAFDWNVLPEEQVFGGRHTLLKAGLIYDTRDNEPNPMKGIWTEAQIIFAPSFLSDKDLGYSKLVLTHRQYFTLVPRDLNLVYRVSYQKKLTGDMPYYMLPFVFNSPPSWTRDGLGGSKTMRGILRNRVVGDDYLFGNLEARWKFLHFDLWKWNIYLALNGFLDGGLVTKEHKLDLSGVPAAYQDYFDYQKEKLHLSAGGGLHVALNENFIVAADYGRALSEQDGSSGFYVGLDFLF